MNINPQLKNYIEKNIFPLYQRNDIGHNIDHINYVIQRSLNFAKTLPKINYDMVYTIAAYHDIGHYIDAKNHEKVSSEILLNDKKLEEFFSRKQINIMSKAVYDHRASLEYEPRNIYGKIVSSADHNTSIAIPLKKTYWYHLNQKPNDSLENIIEESRQHLISKFGSSGYANKKMYFEDIEYEQFLEEIAILLNDKNKFQKRFIKINNIK